MSMKKYRVFCMSMIIIVFIAIGVELYKIIENNKKYDYIIELDKFNISNDNINAKQTTEGINNALEFAKSKGYKKVKLPKGHYSIDTSVVTPITLNDGKNEWVQNRKGIIIQSNMELILTDVILEMIPTNDPQYSIVTLSNCEDSKITGGTILGDRQNHDFGLRINNDGDELETGSYDTITGEPIEDKNMVRTINYIDNFNGETLQTNFILSVLENTSKNTVDGGVRYIYCYDEKENYLGIANGGDSFLSKVELLEGTQKIRVAFKDEKRLDAVYYITEETTYPTHEFGSGITLTDSKNIEINGVTIKDTVGDCILTIAPPVDLSVNNVKILDCTLENSRRQGISLVATGENYLIKGCNIGKINGVDPQSGIDIEHYDYVKNVIIDECNFYDNKKWDIVNYNGTDIEIKNSMFTGGIAATYGYNMKIYNNKFSYLNNKKIDKTYKGFVFLLSDNNKNKEGYFKVYNNIIDGYKSDGNITSSLEKSEFRNNIIKNSTIVIGINSYNNEYYDSYVRYSLLDYQYKDEKFYNCTIGGQDNGTGTETRFFNNFEMNNCEFLSGNPSVLNTILKECEVYNDNISFCKQWGGAYTLIDCNINTEYNENIAFIESQGVNANFINCKMNLSLTPFVNLNYGDFEMSKCIIKFNDNYKEDVENLYFLTNVYGKSIFKENLIDKSTYKDVNIIIE